MGNYNFCCNARDEHLPVQASQKKTINVQETDGDDFSSFANNYRDTIKSVIIVKPELTFGQQMIEDLISLTDENKVPLTQELGWKCLHESEQFKLYGFEWKKEDKQMYNFIEILARANVFRSQFTLKCCLSDYLSLTLDDMKQVNKKIEEMRIIDENNEFDESIRYICYKGVTLLSSRDFVYLKKRQFILGENIFVEAAKSIQDDRVQIEKKRTRGQINLAGQIVEQIDSQTLQIKQFIDVDFRMNMTLNTLQKSVVKEFQKYYESLQIYLQYK